MTTQNNNPVARVVCDSCESEGRYFATKGKQKLTFCAHHIREHETSLTQCRFDITPSDYKFLKA